jgi:hypothetical protein
MSLVLVERQVPPRHDWMVLDLQTSVRGLGQILVLNLAFLLGSVLTDPESPGIFLEPSGSPVCVAQGFQAPEPLDFKLETSGVWANKNPVLLN